MESDAAAPLVSIIIRTKNEERWISHCLKAVFTQSHTNIEVVLVDNNSTDQTVRKAERYPVKVISIDAFLPGDAINKGIMASSGEIISVLSGHCVPTTKFWLENLIKDLSDSQIAGVYGRQEPLSFSSANDKRDLMLVFGLDKKVQSKDPFFHNANSAFLRETWLSFPFDDQVSNIEDRLWGHDVIAAGKKIIYEPNASVFHWHGIHHNLDESRATKIVKIMESAGDLRSKTISEIDTNPKANAVAIIPIKGRSPVVSGRTLLEWTIMSLKASDVVEKIIVCPDSEDTRMLALNLGAKVPFLREELYSQEIISSLDVVRHCLARIEESEFIPDVVVYADETYPFRKPQLLKKMMKKFQDSHLDSLVAAKKEARGVWVETDEGLEMVSGSFEPAAVRVKTAFIAAPGLCFIARPDLIRSGETIESNVGVFEVSDLMSTLQLKTAEDCDTFAPYFGDWIDKN